MARAQDLTVRFWFVTPEAGPYAGTTCITENWEPENRFQERPEQRAVVSKGGITWWRRSATTHTNTILKVMWVMAYITKKWGCTGRGFPWLTGNARRRKPNSGVSGNTGGDLLKVGLSLRILHTSSDTVEDCTLGVNVVKTQKIYRESNLPALTPELATAIRPSLYESNIHPS